jgi:hypothetical protein
VAAPHLYVDPASPLANNLKLPRGFDVAAQPVVTYTLAYLPLSREELRALPDVDVSSVPAYNPSPDFPAYEVPSNASILRFTGAEGYGTMLFSTGAHFAPQLLFQGRATPAQVVAIERAALRAYYADLVRALRPDQRVLVHAAPSGHGDCHLATAPLVEPDDVGAVFNYRMLADVNRALRVRAFVHSL